MILWLKDSADKFGTWTVEEINMIPTGVQCVSIVFGIIATSLVMVYPFWAVISVLEIGFGRCRQMDSPAACLCFIFS